jgi:hypothetical protein
MILSSLHITLQFFTYNFQFFTYNFQFITYNIHLITYIIQFIRYNIQFSYCLQSEYSFAYIIWKLRRMCSISYTNVSMRNFLLLLTIQPTGSDTLSFPTTGWYLYCCSAFPSAFPSLLLRQGVGFETTYKYTLQADYQLI